MLVTRSGVREAVPEMVPEVSGATVNGTTTLALLVAEAGAWMCPPVAGAERPEKLMLYARLLPSKLKVPTAVAEDVVGGTSEAPFNNTEKDRTVLVVCAWTR